MWFPPYRWLRMRLRLRRHHREEREFRESRGRPNDKAFGDRPLLRERYWRLRHRMWQFREAFPTWPLAFRVMISGAMVVAITSAFVGVRAVLRKPAPLVISSSYRQFRDDAHIGNKRVLVAGDASAWALAYLTGGTFEGDGISAVSAAIYGCGIADGDPIFYGKPRKVRADCSNWAGGYKIAIDSFEPDVSVLMVGSGEALDRKVGTSILRAGTPQMEAYLDRQLDLARGILTAKGAKFIITTTYCATQPDGKPDPRRSWVNKVWRNYAAAHSGKVIVADLDAFLCPHGKPTMRLGKPFVEGGRALTVPGAQATWRWLAQEIARSTSK